MPLRRLLWPVLLKCLRGEAATAIGGRKFLVFDAAARDAPARIAARRTVRAWVRHVSQAILMVFSLLYECFCSKGIEDPGHAL